MNSANINIGSWFSNIFSTIEAAKNTKGILNKTKGLLSRFGDDIVRRESEVEYGSKEVIDESFAIEVEKILQRRKEKAIIDREKAIKNLTSIR